MKKFYVASSLNNKAMVRDVSQRLIEKGYLQTYDWTKNSNVTSLEALAEIGRLEREAVLEADFVLVLLPAGKGSHIEFGLALAHDKRVYLYSPDDAINNVKATTTFYHLPQVTKCIGTIDELIVAVVG